MRGRMLTTPFLVAVALLADTNLTMPRSSRFVLLGAVSGLGLLAPNPSLFSGASFGSSSNPHPYETTFGIADERAVYFQQTGLLNGQPLRLKPGHDLSALNARRKLEVVNFKHIRTAGIGGFVSGPHPYIIDEWGLANPLTARISQSQGVPKRIGHIKQVIPAGYHLSLLHGDNRISDKGLHEYYGHLMRITRGPLFTRARWQSIGGMLFGRYQHLIPDSITTAGGQEYATFVAEDLWAGGPSILWRAARAHCLAGDIDSAAPILRRMDSLELAYVDAYIPEAIDIALAFSEQRPQSSEQLLRQVVELEPQDANPPYALSALLMQAGRNKEAMTWLQRAIDLGSERAQVTLERLTDAP